MAISLSVTVSIGEETRGAFNEIPRVSCVVRLTSLTEKSMYPGRMLKSLK